MILLYLRTFWVGWWIRCKYSSFSGTWKAILRGNIFTRPPHPSGSFTITVCVPLLPSSSLTRFCNTSLPVLFRLGVRWAGWILLTSSCPSRLNRQNLDFLMIIGFWICGQLMHDDPHANHDIPTGLVIYIFSFCAYWYAFFSYGFVISKTASKPARANRFVYVSRIGTILTSSFWWTFWKLCFFLYFVWFPSLIAIVFIFYLFVIFPSQTRIHVNIKVIRCLKYSASLVSTQSVLRRNSDNMVFSTSSLVVSIRYGPLYCL